MVQAPSADFIATLRQSNDQQYQLECLKQIKHSIIGHDQRKEQVIKNGILEILVAFLNSADSQASNGHGDSASQALTQSQTTSLPISPVRLESVTVIAVLADGGAQFIAPLLAAGVDKSLTTLLSQSSEEKSINTILRALKSFSQSYALYSESIGLDQALSHSIFTSNTVHCFLSILRPSYQSTVFQKQGRLVCDIISSAAKKDYVKALLVSSNFLDSLVALLITRPISKDIDAFNPVHKQHSSRKPPSSIVAALCTIISGSTYRARRFINCEVVKECALHTLTCNERMRNDPPQNTPGAVNFLPTFQLPQYKGVPIYEESNVFSNLRQGTMDNTADDEAHVGFGVIMWLLGLVRSSRGITRLSALRLLSLIESAVSEADAVTIRPVRIQKMRDRERHLAILAVPLAVKIVQETSDSSFDDDDLSQSEQKTLREEACEVLAMLVEKSKELQCAATDAGAIKYVCPILRKTFDNIVLSKPMWIPNAQAQEENLPTSCKLGGKGLPREVIHVMKCRVGALEALASLADKEDFHRKAIVESGVVSCIIQSLTPMTYKMNNAKPNNWSDADGNTDAVVLAACHAALTLSRSVSLLRTSLIDAGIAKPILDLLHYPKTDIRVAATDVCTNLVLDFSPMREDLLARGVVETLCEHAKHGPSPLKLSSIWALKHLVLTAPIDLKITLLDMLGPTWLVDIITGQQLNNQTQQGGVSIGLNSANAAGEQVDLLNPSEMDVDRVHPAERSEDDNEDGELLYDEASHTHYHSSSLRSTLHSQQGTASTSLPNLEDGEPDPAIQHRQDDLATQTQALDFVRNLLTGEQCAEMVDHLFQRIGQQKFLDLLTSKLSPISTWQHRHHLRPSTASKSSTRPLYSPTELISAAVHVVVHIANGSVAQKGALIAHKALLQALQPHFSHPDHRVRVMCVWCVNALTFLDDERDLTKAQERAHELRILGIDSATRCLINDPDLDVRERVKTAVRQLDAL